MKHSPHKRPRGRPPIGAVWENGEYRLTDEGLRNAVERLETHRKKCRDRYRNTRDALKRARPDLFEKGKRANQSVLTWQKDEAQESE